MRSFYHPDMENTVDSERMRLAKLEERTKAGIRRLERLERLGDEVHAQNETLARLVVRLETLTADLEKLEKRLSEIEHVPANRYTAIVGAVITALVSAFVGGAVTVLF